MIQSKYHPARYNIYPVHFTDGENLTADNEKCLKYVQELMGVSSMFGYGEVNVYNRYSTLMSIYKKIDNPKFRHYILRQKADVYDALRSFLQKKELPV